MLVLSHRGSHSEVPENTHEAFERALFTGVDGLETDVRLSVDGIPLLFHDRVAPNGQPVASLTYAELCRVAGYEVPTLESALIRWQDAYWNLEIKAPEALGATVEIVRGYSGRTRFLISSFWHPVVEAFCESADVEGGILLAHRPQNLHSFFSSVRATGRLKSIIWDYETVDDELIRAATAEGWANGVYGALTEPEHARLMNLDVDLVITDRPEFVRRG